MTDELLKVLPKHKQVLKKRKEDPLAPYRDKSERHLCAGCDFANTFRGHKSLQDQSICRNCVVTAIKNGEATPEHEENF